MSGFDFTFVSQVPAEYICLICQCAMRKPVQTKCGHRFCKDCLQQAMERLKECPIDRNLLDESCATDIYPDVASERSILDFQVKCPNENNGCEWTGELRSVEAHEETCLFTRVSCTNDNCDVTILKKDLQRHVTNECPRRRMECDYCKESYVWCLKKDHFKECGTYPCSCVQECGQHNIPRNEMNDHIERVCLLTEVNCTFAHVGCQVKVQRNALSQHVQANIESHLNLSCKKLEELETIRETTEKEINELKTELQLLQTAHNATQRQLLELQATATESHLNLSCKKLQELQAEHKATKTQITELQAEHEATKIHIEELLAAYAATEKELRELRIERVTSKELHSLQTAHDATKKKIKILTFFFVFIISVWFAWFAYTDKKPNEQWTARVIRKELQLLQAANDATMTLLQELHAARASTEKDLQELQATYDATKKELKTLKTQRVTRKELQLLQTAQEVTKKELKTLNTERVTRKELQLLQTAHDAIKKELKTLNTERVTRKELQLLQTAHKATKTQLQELQPKIVSASLKNVCRGEFIWKFTEFGQYLKKATYGTQTRFYSNSLEKLKIYIVCK